jgi:hypothetical protein
VYLEQPLNAFDSDNTVDFSFLQRLPFANEILGKTVWPMAQLLDLEAAPGGMADAAACSRMQDENQHEAFLPQQLVRHAINETGSCVGPAA